MFTYPKFDIDIARRVNLDALGWPERSEARDETGLGCNRSYIDLRRMTWHEALRVADLERQLTERITLAPDLEAEREAVEEELYDSDEGLYGLDLGIAGTVIALSAARCVPFSSCNAGAFGGRHHERYPLVAFYARKDIIHVLMKAAEEAKIGLESDRWLIAYADDIRKMMRFATALCSRSAVFRAIRKPSSTTNARIQTALNTLASAQRKLEFAP